MSTIPSDLRLKVALVGQTRTQGGFSQWLQSTGKVLASTSSGRWAYS